MSNQRRSPRIPIRLPVTLHDRREPEPTETFDVSRHGIGLRTMKPRPLRQYVALRVTLPEGETMQLTAMVARAEDTAAGVAGLDFYLLDRDTQRRWNSFLEAQTTAADDGPPAETPPAQPENAIRPERPRSNPPVFIVKPPHTKRLWAFYAGELLSGQIRLESPVPKAEGTEVEVLVVHPETEAEWPMPGRVIATEPSDGGDRTTLQIALPPASAETRAAFRRFIEVEDPASGETASDARADADDTRKFEPAEEDATRRFEPPEDDATRRFEPPEDDATRRFEPPEDDATRRFEPTEGDATRRFASTEGDATRPISAIEDEVTQSLEAADASGPSLAAAGPSVAAADARLGLRSTITPGDGTAFDPPTEHHECVTDSAAATDPAPALRAADPATEGESASAPTERHAALYAELTGGDSAPEAMALQARILSARDAVLDAPRDPARRLALARLLLTRNAAQDASEAEMHLQRLLKFEPDHAEAHHALAVAYHRSGRAERAAEHLGRAKRMGYAVRPDLEAELQRLPSS